MAHMLHYMARLLEHPMALWLAWIPPVFLMVRLGVRLPRWDSLSAGRIAFPAALALLGVFYFASPSFFDHVEPHVACVSTAWSRSSAPIFHGLDAPERYTIFYGPSLYLAVAAAESLQVASPISLAKVPPLLAILLAASILAAWTFRRTASAPAARRVVAWSCGWLLIAGIFALWCRPEAFLVLLTTLGLCSLFAASSRRAALGLGVCCGLAVTLKIYAFLLFVPHFAWLARRNPRALLPAGLAALAAAAVPFLLPGVSLSHHLAWLGQIPRQEFSATYLRFNVEMLVFLLSSSLMLVSDGALRAIPGVWRDWSRHAAGRRRLVFVVLAGLLTLCPLTIAASKLGAGWHYFLPLVPILAAAAVLMNYQHDKTPATWPADVASARSSVATFRFALQLTFLSLVLYHVAATVGAVRMQYADGPALIELRAILDKRPGQRIAMGSEGFQCGRTNESLSWLRPELTRRGSPYLFDPASMVDYTACRLPLPARTLSYFDGSVFDVWLVPRGSSPFLSFPYPPEIRATFLRNYVPKPGGFYFDVWERAISTSVPESQSPPAPLQPDTHSPP